MAQTQTSSTWLHWFRSTATHRLVRLSSMIPKRRFANGQLESWARLPKFNWTMEKTNTARYKQGPASPNLFLGKYRRVHGLAFIYIQKSQLLFFLTSSRATSFSFLDSKSPFVGKVACPAGFCNNMLFQEPVAQQQPKLDITFLSSPEYGSSLFVTRVPPFLPPPILDPWLSGPVFLCNITKVANLICPAIFSYQISLKQSFLAQWRA